MSETSQDQPEIVIVTDAEGIQHEVIPEGHVAVPKDQLEELLQSHQELRQNYQILNADMGVAVRGNITIMSLMGGKADFSSIVKLGRKFLNKKSGTEEMMAPFDYIIRKYARAEGDSKGFQQIKYETTFEQWQEQQKAQAKNLKA